MAIEHRGGSSQEIAIHRVIEYPPRGLVQGEIRDIRISGLFVRTTVRLDLHTHVKLVLVCNKGGVTHLLPRRAMVVRTARDGADMMFDEIKPAKLDRILHRAHAVAGRELFVRAAPARLSALTRHDADDTCGKRCVP